jgi:hypothetical protein
MHYKNLEAFRKFLFWNFRAFEMFEGGSIVIIIRLTSVQGKLLSFHQSNAIKLVETNSLESRDDLLAQIASLRSELARREVYRQCANGH